MAFGHIARHVDGMRPAGRNGEATPPRKLRPSKLGWIQRRRNHDVPMAFGVEQMPEKLNTLVHLAQREWLSTVFTIDHDDLRPTGLVDENAY